MFLRLPLCTCISVQACVAFMNGCVWPTMQKKKDRDKNSAPVCLCVCMCMLGVSDALELPFFFPDKDSICHRAICCLPSRQSVLHAAFTLMSPLHSSRFADATHRHTHTLLNSTPHFFSCVHTDVYAHSFHTHKQTHTFSFCHTYCLCTFTHIHTD